MVPDMDHLCSRPCTISKCYAEESLQTQKWWLQNHSGKMAMTNTASLCQILGGLRNRSFNTMTSHWKTIPTFATKQARSRNEKSWIPLNAEGIQGPLNQRRDFKEATNIQKSLEKETNQSLLHNKSGNGLINNLDDLEPRTGWRFYPSSRTTHSSSSSHWQPSSDWKSTWSWDSWQTSSWTGQYFSLSRDVISLAGNLISWQSMVVCRQTHLPRTTFSHAQSLHRRVFTCCQTVQSHIGLHAPAWLKTRNTLSAFHPKTFTPHPRRAMSYNFQNLTHGHSFLTFSRTSLPAF